MKTPQRRLSPEQIESGTAFTVDSTPHLRRYLFIEASGRMIDCIDLWDSTRRQFPRTEVIRNAGRKTWTASRPRYRYDGVRLQFLVAPNAMSFFIVVGKKTFTDIATTYDELVGPASGLSSIHRRFNKTALRDFQSQILETRRAIRQKRISRDHDRCDYPVFRHAKAA